MSSNINSEYEAQIDSIAGYVMDQVREIHKEDPEREIDDLSEIINNEIDERSIYYADQAYYLARYHLENGFPDDGVIRWDQVWEMVYNDVYEAVDEKMKEEFGE